MVGGQSPIKIAFVVSPLKRKRYSLKNIQTTQINKIINSLIENFFIYYFFSCRASTNTQPKNITAIGKFKDT